MVRPSAGPRACAAGGRGTGAQPAVRAWRRRLRRSARRPWAQGWGSAACARAGAWPCWATACARARARARGRRRASSSGPGATARGARATRTVRLVLVVVCDKPQARGAARGRTSAHRCRGVRTSLPARTRSERSEVRWCLGVVQGARPKQKNAHVATTSCTPFPIIDPEVSPRM
jgi:hypothetical protein